MGTILPLRLTMMPQDFPAACPVHNNQGLQQYIFPRYDMYPDTVVTIRHTI